MHALHALGEQGGWPLTMFLDREARPFWGGTYFPTDAALRPAGLRRRADRGRAASTARSPTRSATTPRLLIEALAERRRTAAPTATHRRRAARRISPTRMVDAVDPRHGGLARRAEFPAVELLLAALARRHPLRPRRRRATPSTPRSPTSARAASTITSAAASRATPSTSAGSCRTSRRCSTTTRSSLDLLTRGLAGDRQRRSTRARIDETVGWLLREMIAEGGGFAATLDAD